MQTPFPDTTNERPTQSATSDCIAWLKTIELKLPKLSSASLMREAFAHYDAQLPDGQAKAEEIVVGFLRNVSRDQESSARRRKEKWVNNCVLGYLRNQIALSNPEITKLAEKTKSQAIRNAVIAKIYDAVKSQYPRLAQEIAEARARALGKTNGKAAVQPDGNGSQAEASVAEEQLPEAWKEDAIVRGQVTQVVNLMLICLKEVHHYLVPTAAASGITVDADAARAWAVSAFIEICKSSKAHFKLSPEREVTK
jgi:hypothetical protein